ncbi:uncharacterized protein BJ171DRAFT_528134 [Polychytrium aggregatum]|uniref:uncharacterized protein n=1 Tax=Polychytrium aggregatum TaxID=110093 RepID=UPI0022FDF59C|nr:uncharacterized protein BJ171DRAFT_528134 [Polychytrium aggregatum]KAI9193377.1 hypothetical protein BJ171DRAFT_528134 [Polychytrium aggregatum]
MSTLQDIPVGAEDHHRRPETVPCPSQSVVCIVCIAYAAPIACIVSSTCIVSGSPESRRQRGRRVFLVVVSPALEAPFALRLRCLALGPCLRYSRQMNTSAPDRSPSRKDQRSHESHATGHITPHAVYSYPLQRIVFTKQAPALRLQDLRPELPFLFAYELSQPHTGPRYYFPASLDDFWPTYLAFKPSERCFHEVIRHDRPCKLYFDLEFDKSKHQTVNTQDIMERFRHIVITHLTKLFDIPAADCTVVDLDSTSAVKFSRHLIINIRGVCFESSLHVGAFVRDLRQRLYLKAFSIDQYPSYVASSPIAIDTLAEVDPEYVRSLFLDESLGINGLFVDCSVYSRNRNFRILGSRKPGRTEIFSPTNPVHASSITLEYFRTTLVSACEQGARRISFKAPQTDLSAHFPHTREARSFLAVQSDDFADLENYLLQRLRERSPSAALGDPVYELTTDGPRLFYPIKGDRYCEVRGRQHKSNGTFFNISMSSGTFTECCFDHDCRGHMRITHLLPVSIKECLQSIQKKIGTPHPLP